MGATIGSRIAYTFGHRSSFLLNLKSSCCLIFSLLCSVMSSIILVFVLFHLAIVSSVLGIMISDSSVSSSLFEQSKNYRNEGGIWPSDKQLLTVIQWFLRGLLQIKNFKPIRCYISHLQLRTRSSDRFWRDPVRVSQQTTDQRSRTDTISLEPLALVSKKKTTQPDLGFSSCEQNVFFGKKTPNPNLTCILSF